MPYIEQAARTQLTRDNPNTTGELNYAITKLVQEWLDRQDLKLRYQHLNAAIGVLECAKLELYRRIAAPYEDEKARENGDVLPRNAS